MTAIMKIRFLGGFQIIHDGQPVDGLESLKLQSLFAFIAVHRQAPLARRHIAFLLWPDSSESQAMANLRNLLFALRRSIPECEKYLDINPPTVRWRQDSSFELDVAAFEQAAIDARSIPELTRAVQLYSGDLLPGHFDEWILEERDRLHLLYKHVLERLVQLHEQGQDYANAIYFAQRLLDTDALDENIYRRLMTLHALTRDRAAAINVYHRCTETLMRELAVEPGKETKEMYELLLSADASPSPPMVVSASPLVGRSEEWRNLQVAWSASMRGRAQIVLLLGEAGIGKSRLAEEMIQWAFRQGIACATARCYAAEQSLAFAPVTQWLRSCRISSAGDPWLVEVSRLLPEIAVQRPDLPAPRPMQENWQRQVFFDALVNTISSSNRPLLLWIDDLQWCDQDSMEWIHFYLQKKQEDRLLVIATARPEELESNRPAQSLITAFSNSGRLTRIHLNALDPQSTTALGAHVAGRPLEETEEAGLFKESEGNPLFIIELLRARADHALGSVSEKDSLPPRGGWGFTPGIYQVIQERLNLVSPDAQQLAGLAAVLGSAFPYPVLYQSGGLEENTLVNLLDELWRKGIIREQGKDGYAFSHDKIREVVYAGLSSARRRLLHRKAGEAIAEYHSHTLDMVSHQVAYHFAEAGLAELAAHHYLRAAGRASRLFSTVDSIAYLERGLALVCTLPESTGRDEIELSYQLALGAQHLARLIRAPEVRQHYARAYDLAQKAGAEQQRFDALKGLWEIDNYWLNLEKARRLGEEMLLFAAQQDDPSFEVISRYSLGTTAFLYGDFQGSKAHLEEGVRLDHDRLCDYGSFSGAHPGVGCLARLAWTLWFLGDIERALQAADESVELAKQLGHPYSQCLALTLETFLLLMFREKEWAARLAEQAIALAEQYDYRFWSSSALRMYGWATIDPNQGLAWEKLLENENQVWLTIHSVKPAIWFTLSQSLYVMGQAESGRVEQGLSRLREIIAKLDESVEKIWLPELYRMQGELLLKRGSGQEEAEDYFRQAIDLAHTQGSLLLELRAATSLCRLRAQQGDGEADFTTLKRLAGAFPAHLRLPDIQEARKLLGQT